MKRKSTSSAQRENPKIVLSKALNVLTSKQEAFIKAVEAMQELKKEELVKYDLEIEAKQEELEELEEKYKNSEKGKFFKYLQNGIEDAKNILYSGLSIEDVWKNLEQVFGQAQIEVRVPKSFTQISK